MLQEILNNIFHCSVKDPAAAATADFNTKAIDRALAIGSSGTYKQGGLGANAITFAFIVGAVGDTLSGAVYTQIYLQESDDSTDGNDGNWTTVPDANLVYDRKNVTLVSNTMKFTVNADLASQTHVLGYVGGKRWVRGVWDTTGTHTNGTFVAVAALLGLLNITPASNAGN